MSEPHCLWVITLDRAHHLGGAPSLSGGWVAANILYAPYPGAYGLDLTAINCPSAHRLAALDGDQSRWGRKLTPKEILRVYQQMVDAQEHFEKCATKFPGRDDWEDLAHGCQVWAEKIKGFVIPETET